MTKAKNKHIYEILEENPHLKEVNGGWAPFTIKIVAGLKAGKQNCWGTCDFDTYEIHLEKKIEDAPARETLLHEITHMLLELCGMGGEGEGENEEFIWASNEKLTITMSRAFMMFTRLNPELAKELLLL